MINHFVYHPMLSVSRWCEYSIHWATIIVGHLWYTASEGGVLSVLNNKTSWVFLVVLKWKENSSLSCRNISYPTPLDDDERHLYHHKSISLLTHQSIFMSIVGYWCRYVVNSASHPISESSSQSQMCNHHLKYMISSSDMMCMLSNMWSSSRSSSKKIRDTKDLERHIRWTYDDIHIINCWLSYRICFLSLQRLTYQWW